MLSKDGQMRKGCLLPQGASSNSWKGKNLTGQLPPAALLCSVKCLAPSRGSGPQTDAVGDRDGGEHLHTKSSAIDSFLSGGPTPHFPREWGILSLHSALMGAFIDASRVPGLRRILGWKLSSPAFQESKHNDAKLKGLGPGRAQLR